MQTDLVSGFLLSVALCSQVQGRIAKTAGEQEVKQCTSFARPLMSLIFTLISVHILRRFETHVRYHFTLPIPRVLLQLTH
jgi:hypothetical protein